MAVYAPGSNVTQIADSRSFVGGMPVAMLQSDCGGGNGGSRQLLLMMVSNPCGPCSSSTGSASASGTIKEGPRARRMTRLGALPVMMNPPIPTLASVPTCIRVERLSACAAGVGLGLGVELGDGVADAVAVGVGVAV